MLGRNLNFASLILLAGLLGGCSNDLVAPVATDVPDTSQPACVPQCAGKLCGDDGCGDSCGACPNTCTGQEDVPALCTAGACTVPCGRIDVNITYVEDGGYEDVQVYLLDTGGCPAPGPIDPAKAAAKAGPDFGQPSFFELSPAPTGPGRTVVVVATGGDTGFAFGCTDGVSVGATTSVDVTVLPFEADFTGVWLLDNLLIFGDSLPTAVEKVVTGVEEMNDDHDLLDENKDDNQYGEDPAAFFLDVIVRQFCCWTATGDDPDWDSCKAQDSTHPVGDLRELYLQDFSKWNGAQPRIPTLCALLDNGVLVAMQDQISILIDEKAPLVDSFFPLLTDGLSKSMRNMKIGSKLTISAPVGGIAVFKHTLVSVTFGLQTSPDAPSVPIVVDMAEAGMTGLTKTGQATLSGQTVQLSEHTYELDFGKLLHHAYNTKLLPLTGSTSTLGMFQNFIDCDDIGAKVDGAIGIGLLSAEDFAGYCVDGLEEGATLIDEGIEGAVSTTSTVTLGGMATAQLPDATGAFQALENGIWNGSWVEDPDSDTFDGTFSGTRGTGK